jgi:hypothetical protein
MGSFGITDRTIGEEVKMLIRVEGYNELYDEDLFI